MNKQFDGSQIIDTSHRGLFGTMRMAIKQYGFIGSAARYLLYIEEKNNFLRHEDGYSYVQRKKLINTFEKINNSINCAYSPAQDLQVSKLLLTSRIPGPIIEFGAYKGCGTAKLSILATFTNRKLYVFDSFKGLPMLTKADKGVNNVFNKGDWMGSLNEVRGNVKKYGNTDVCHFVPGYYNKTLKNILIKPFLVIMDVDLISSARTCLKHMWPLTVPGGVWFTHEASISEYIDGVFNSKWWSANVGEKMPILIGAYTGFSPTAPSTAYFVKR